MRIAETEKYAHVTFFFNGGREIPFDGERRLMAHSPKVPTYDLQPEMSAHDIVDLIVPEIKGERGEAPDFTDPLILTVDRHGLTVKAAIM